MIKVKKVLVVGLLALSACKPRELSLIHASAHKVRVSTADNFVYAELADAGHKIFTANHKQYAWYGKGLIHITQGNYSGKLLNGHYEAFLAKNKQLKEKGKYAFGLKKGKWMVWRSDGHLLEIQHWSEGLKNGRSVLFDSLGKVKGKLKYSKGQLVEKKKGSGLVTHLKSWIKGKKK